jgi:hypothetical protein
MYCTVHRFVRNEHPWPRFWSAACSLWGLNLLDRLENDLVYRVVGVSLQLSDGVWRDGGRREEARGEGRAHKRLP